MRDPIVIAHEILKLLPPTELTFKNKILEIIQEFSNMPPEIDSNQHTTLMIIVWNFLNIDMNTGIPNTPKDILNSDWKIKLYSLISTYSENDVISFIKGFII